MSRDNKMQMWPATFLVWDDIPEYAIIPKTDYKSIWSPFLQGLQDRRKSNVQALKGSKNNDELLMIPGTTKYVNVTICSIYQYFIQQPNRTANALLCRLLPQTINIWVDPATDTVDVVHATIRVNSPALISKAHARFYICTTTNVPYYRRVLPGGSSHLFWQVAGCIRSPECRTKTFVFK